ncbi:MAG: LysR family transcriptional regulator [Anderseniella sp.]
MDKFRAIQVFIAVADKRGFAAAARSLNISPPAVTRTVSMLEDDLGTPLFVRTTRSVRLTESGERFLEDARRILLELEEAQDAAVGTHAAPRGQLHVTAPVLFGRMYVTPVLSDFLNLHPQLSARTLFVDRVVNLVDEGQDVAIRIGPLPDSSLIAVRCGTVRQLTVASPDYLAKHGLPGIPESLTGHQIIQATGTTPGNDWRFQHKDKSISVRLEPRVSMNTNDAVIELLLRGGGISRLLSYQVAPHLADGRLQVVLEAFENPPQPVHVVHQEGRLVSSKVRAFVDFMVQHLRENMGEKQT